MQSFIIYIVISKNVGKPRKVYALHLYVYSSSSADRDKDFSASRIRDKWWGMLMMEGKDKASANASSPIKIKSSKQADTTHRFGEIEWWTCEQVCAISLHVN